MIVENEVGGSRSSAGKSLANLEFPDVFVLGKYFPVAGFFAELGPDPIPATISGGPYAGVL